MPPVASLWDPVRMGAALGLPLGGLLGWGAYHAQHSFWIGQVLPRQLYLGLWAVGLVIPLLVMWPIVLVSQRARVVLAYALAVGLSSASGTQLIAVLMRSDGGLNVGHWANADLLEWTGVIVVWSVVVSLVLTGVVRLVLFRGVEADDRHCAWCRYEYGSATISRCPECGRPRNTGPHLTALSLAVGGWIRRSRVFFAASVLGVGVWAGVLVYQDVIPPARLYHRYPTAINVFSPNGYHSGLSIGALASDWTPILVIPVDLVQDGALVVYYQSGPATIGDQQMTISAARFSTSSTIGADGVQWQALARLNPRQTDWVVRHGVPRSLQDALLKEQQSQFHFLGEVDASMYVP